MRHTIWFFPLLALTMSGCGTAQPPGDLACNLTAIDQTALSSAKETGFETMEAADFSNSVTALSTCLGHSDPAIRDELAYATLTAMLRSGQADPDLVRDLRDRLYMQLDSPDPDGLLHPFAALVLSEVTRVDRVSPYLSDGAREDMVQRAADFMTSETDYRGFSDADGWRHNIAHGADWLMQLALNPALTEAQRVTILDAVAEQVQAGSGHAYIHGEAERLARPYLFAAMQGADDEAVWQERLSALADPAPMADWSEAYKTEAGLARLHNLKAFLQQLYINTSASSNERLKPLQEAVTANLRALP